MNDAVNTVCKEVAKDAPQWGVLVAVFIAFLQALTHYLAHQSGVKAGEKRASNSND